MLAACTPNLAEFIGISAGNCFRLWISDVCLQKFPHIRASPATKTRLLHSKAGFNGGYGVRKRAWQDELWLKHFHSGRVKLTCREDTGTAAQYNAYHPDCVLISLRLPDSVFLASWVIRLVQPLDSTLWLSAVDCSALLLRCYLFERLKLRLDLMLPDWRRYAPSNLIGMQTPFFKGQSIECDLPLSAVFLATNASSSLFPSVGIVVCKTNGSVAG